MKNEKPMKVNIVFGDINTIFPFRCPICGTPVISRYCPKCGIELIYPFKDGEQLHGGYTRI